MPKWTYSWFHLDQVHLWPLNSYVYLVLNTSSNIVYIYTSCTNTIPILTPIIFFIVFKILLQVCSFWPPRSIMTSLGLNTIHRLVGEKNILKPRGKHIGISLQNHTKNKLRGQYNNILIVVMLDLNSIKVECQNQTNESRDQNSLIWYFSVCCAHCIIFGPCLWQLLLYTMYISINIW